MQVNTYIRAVGKWNVYIVLAMPTYSTPLDITGEDKVQLLPSGQLFVTLDQRVAPVAALNA